MDAQVDVVGVYPVDADEPCHLVELHVRDFVGVFDAGEFTQEAPGQPKDNWQVPYDERLLDSNGFPIVSGNVFPEFKSEGSMRLTFFFHYLDFA